MSLRSAAGAEATEDEMSEEVPSPPGEANLFMNILTSKGGFVYGKILLALYIIPLGGAAKSL